jgi:hypothetical protein
MNIVYKKTKDLIQYARNNKKHEEVREHETTYNC